MHDHTLLFIPGINAAKQQPLFDSLKREAEAHDIDALYFDLWKGADDLETMSIRHITQEINAAVTSLRRQGYKKVSAIGKSFGGSMVLIANPPLDSLVLWAPAIGIAEEGNAGEFLDTPLSQVESIFSITLGDAELQRVETPVLILQGSADEVASPENSSILQSRLPGAHLEVIPGMGHSPQNEEEIGCILENTLSHCSAI